MVSESLTRFLSAKNSSIDILSEIGVILVSFLVRFIILLGLSDRHHCRIKLNHLFELELTFYLYPAGMIP